VISHSYRNGKLTFDVYVVPRASRSEVVGEHDEALRVRVAAPPVEGAANEELLRTLAKAFNLPVMSIAIIHGQRGKRKTICVTGDCEKLLGKLQRIG
jgi:uncharacterized protein (TIGR00251 family)